MMFYRETPAANKKKKNEENRKTILVRFRWFIFIFIHFFQSIDSLIFCVKLQRVHICGIKKSEGVFTNVFFLH